MRIVKCSVRSMSEGRYLGVANRGIVCAKSNEDYDMDIESEMLGSNVSIWRDHNSLTVLWRNTLGRVKGAR